MSPEQALGRALDARSDVFSIGAILYELVTGQRAFDGADVDEILKMVVRTDPPPLSSVRSGIPPVLGEIIFRALAKDPAHRYQTAGQLRNDLAAFAGRPVAPSTSPPGGEFAASSVPVTRWHLPGPGALVATGAAVIGLTLTFAIWYLTHRTDSDEADAARTGATTVQAAPPPAVPAAIKGELSLAPPTPPASSAPPEGAKQVTPRPAARAHVAAAPPSPAAPPPPLEPGTLSLAIAPWGEVFLDGGSVGVSPPLTRIDLSPGKHSVEVRNGSFPAYSLQVDIETGKTLVLQHRF